MYTTDNVPGWNHVLRSLDAADAGSACQQIMELDTQPVHGAEPVLIDDDPTAEYGFLALSRRVWPVEGL